MSDSAASGNGLDSTSPEQSMQVRAIFKIHELLVQGKNYKDCPDPAPDLEVRL